MNGLFQCVDKEELHINGHLNSDNARTLSLKVRKCIDREFCADAKTIQNYFAGTYIDLLQNQIRFDFREFGESSIIKESVTRWIRLQTQIQVEVPFLISRTEVQLQDQFVNFDEITEMTDNGVFRMEQMTPRPSELVPETVMALTFEVNPDLAVITRNNYTALDLLSDVGGLAEVLFFIMSIVVSLANYGLLNNFLAS